MVRTSTPAAYRILTYGYDAVLLDTRRLLLNQAGYDVEVVASPEAFEAALKNDKSSYELLVLCHTVPDDEQRAISVSAQELKAAVYKVPALVPPTDFLAHVSSMLQ